MHEIKTIFLIHADPRLIDATREGIHFFDVERFSPAGDEDHRFVHVKGGLFPVHLKMIPYEALANPGAYQLCMMTWVDHQRGKVYQRPQIVPRKGQEVSFPYCLD